jgi:hypothetical protein
VAGAGYQPVVVTRKAPQQVPAPSIGKIDHGVFGQLLVWIMAVAKAASYEIRFAPVTGGTVGSWATVPTTTVKSAVPVDGLTPGTQDTFQVRPRSLGLLGLERWRQLHLYLAAGVDTAAPPGISDVGASFLE